MLWKRKKIGLCWHNVQKEVFLSFAMRRAYQGDWMDAIPSRFINELPDENIEKNEVFKDDNEDEFEFNQDQPFDLETIIEVQAGIDLRKSY